VRLLHVTPFYEPAWAYGGMARASSGLCRALARRGHAVTVVTAQLAAQHPTEEELGGVRVHRFPGPRALAEQLMPFAPGLGLFLRQSLGAVDVAHLHGHRNGLAWTAHRFLAETGIAWLLQPCGTFPHHGQRAWAKAAFDRLAGDAIVAGASSLMAVSEAEAAELPRRATVVANGVDPCGRPRVSERGPRPRLLFVGNDSFQKRAHRLQELLERLPEVELALVGRFASEFPSRLGAAAARVHPHGVLHGDALASAYASADVLVHPAVGEAFGLVPFEAALAGTASVVAGGHGCGEWFDRAGGCVVPPEDMAAMAQAVSRRLREPERRRDEARAVAAFVRAKLTWDAAAAQVEVLYERALAARVGRA
jgi:glycosyltransferase involved in cell wall biosynthesis